MASPQTDQDARVAQSVVYLVASVLLILAFSLITLFLEAELNNQQSLQGTSEPVAIEQVSPPPATRQKQRTTWFQGRRHADEVPGVVGPANHLG